MGLGHIAELCFNITQSYLELSGRTEIISETQEAVKLTKKYFLEDIFSVWNPFTEEISFSYNGGKDCQLLLLLYLGCLWEFFLSEINGSQFDAEYQRFTLVKLPTVFISHEETFETLEQFLYDTSERYSLSLYESDEKSVTMSEAFEKYLKSHPSTKAIIIGIRHTDPYAESLQPIQKTDANWPDFMRLQPILHWKLASIWSFLLYSGEPLCALYKVGFTSVGNINETTPNPYLKIVDNTIPKSAFQWEIDNSYTKANNVTVSFQENLLELAPEDKKRVQRFDDQYLPGWYLLDDSLERAGRVKKPRNTPVDRLDNCTV